MPSTTPSNGQSGTDSVQATTAFSRDELPNHSSQRQHVVFVPGGGSSPHFTQEVVCLLHRRLRIASLIGLAGFAAFLAWAFVLLQTDRQPPLVGMILHGVVVVLLGAACTVLWSRNCLSMTALRWLEGLVFGAMGLFFAYLQFAAFYTDGILRHAATDEGKKFLYISVSTANSLRWLILIVLYGTFIPNTWRRSATVIGIMALTPILLSFAIGCRNCPVLGKYVWSGVPEMTMVLGIASTIAIFGSYKIRDLERKAFQAQMLGQYVLRRKLGQGGMGEVYLAEHRLLRRPCAVKLVRREQALDPTTLTRFEREVRSMAALTHWNTVEVYDYGLADDGTFYYVMEYLPGLSLQDLVDRHGPISPARAVHFLRQICGALREAHGIGLTHRDIKPSNAIVCERGGVHDVVKLLDFGLVHTPDMNTETDHRLTLQGTILGSPSYMSPEQAMGKNQLDGRSDIYSLGALGYFLLTGQPPFVRETAMELLVAHMHSAPEPIRDFRPEVPPDLEDILLRCLSKKPEERFRNVLELDQALAECSVGEPWSQERASHWWAGRPLQVAEHRVPALAAL